MSTKETGGPAFPVADTLIDGMTLRDYFAAKAISGLIGRNWSSHQGSDKELIAIWATSAYAMADAMLEARK